MFKILFIMFESFVILAQFLSIYRFVDDAFCGCASYTGR